MENKINEISEKYGKYLFKIKLVNKDYFFVWGRELTNDEEFLLKNNDNKIILFENFNQLNSYINEESQNVELSNWIDELKIHEEYGILYFDIIKEISSFSLLTYNDIILCEKISIFIELCDDILFLNKENSDNIITRNIEDFKEFYYNNFVWNDKEKNDFEIDTIFRRDFLNLLNFILNNMEFTDGKAPLPLVL